VSHFNFINSLLIKEKSLNFFIKDVNYLECFGNEKGKKEVYLGGVVSFVWVNIIVLI